MSCLWIVATSGYLFSWCNKVRTDITLAGANNYRIQIEGDAISVVLIFLNKFICSNMSKRIRSDIWNRFEDVGNNKARCKLCRQDIGYRGGSTSSALTSAHYQATPHLQQVKLLVFMARHLTVPPKDHASPLLINFCHHSSHHLIINAGPWMTSFFICRNRYPMLIQTHYKWWQLNGSRYPRLLNLALKYLGIQSTSTPSERVFSKAGDKLAAWGPIWNHRQLTCGYSCQKISLLSISNK
jgi:hypothetical protein